MVSLRGKENTGVCGEVFQGQLLHRGSSVVAVLHSCHQAVSCGAMAQLWVAAEKVPEAMEFSPLCSGLSTKAESSARDSI